MFTAKTQITAPVSGNQPFTVPFEYLKAEHVKAFVEGQRVAFTWLNPSMIQLSANAGQRVEIVRDSDGDTNEVMFDFQDGGILREEDLNSGIKQAVFLGQEAKDRADGAINLTLDNTWDAQGKRIENVGNPVNPGDAINKATLAYDYPMVEYVGQNMVKVSLVANDLSNIGLYEMDLGDIQDNLTVLQSGQTSAIVRVADAINDVKLVSDTMDEVQVLMPHLPAIHAVADSIDEVTAIGANTTAVVEAAQLITSNQQDFIDVANNITSLVAISNDLKGTTFDILDMGSVTELANPPGGTVSTSALRTVAENIDGLLPIGNNIAVVLGAPVAASNAAASATAASSSATAAATSATNSSGSASAASTSATNAASSATTANTKATAANTSATNAATSATLSQDWATKTASEVVAGQGFGAKKYANDASASATAASTSATNAASSATTASTKAGEAATSATNAASSATTASTKAGEAATSATNAATSATTASTKAGEAATSATNAASSATTSSTKAGEAATSATDAATSATTALNHLNTFKGQYYGSLAADPTNDPLGGALGAGDLYFNSASGEMRVYSGTAWVAAYASLAGALVAANNLSDIPNKTTARTNLGLTIGTNVQAYDADLAAIAALAGTSGILKKTAANTWALDTSAYLTAVPDASVTSTKLATTLDMGTL